MLSFAIAGTICYAAYANLGGRMPAGLLRTIAIVTACVANGAVAVAGGPPHDALASARGTATVSRSAHALKARSHAPGLNRNGTRTRAADRDPYADPAAPYKADRLSSSRSGPILNMPGQTTVLTRQVLDDMNATTLRDAMRSTAGVTVGR
jgi:outer membrane receptor for monomeric catechols